MQEQASESGATPSAREGELLLERRHAIGTNWPCPGDAVGFRGLSLSGGGIRSATFSLGVLQAIAKCRIPREDAQASSGAFKGSLLSSFDYLSTVSGGGYIGGFLCSLFQPGRLRSGGSSGALEPSGDALEQGVQSLNERDGRKEPPTALNRPAVLAAADDAVGVLSSGPPGRIRSDQSYAGDERINAPLAWLRENGRYLIPTGVGDAFYAAALGIRNWLALHYVIGTALVPLIALVGLARIWAIGDGFVTFEHQLLCSAVRFHAEAQIAKELGCINVAASLIWWSPIFLFGAAVLIVVGVPLGVAFWLVDEASDGTSKPWNLAVLMMLVVVATMLGIALVEWEEPRRALKAAMGANDPTFVAQGRRLALVAVIILAASLAIAVYVVTTIFCGWSAALQRVCLTRRLSDVLVICVCITFVALVDTIGQTLYVAATYRSGLSAVLTPAGAAAAFVWVAKRLAATAPRDGAPSWSAKLPIATIAGIAGILIFILVGSLWSMLVQWLVWGGDAPTPSGRLHSPFQREILASIMLGTTLMAGITGLFVGFINLSSLQPFYSSRLTRAYLGASNGDRFAAGSAALSAAEPLPNDDLALAAYVEQRSDGPHLGTLAPLHIINVTVNKTVDPAEQLVQRDRKGQPMAVLPFGFSIDQRWRDGFPKAGVFSAISRPLPVGQWIGTSGAAFSTGIGRETSLGMSLLMGAANVRLGTWWRSEVGGSSPKWTQWLARGFGAVFRTQTYLSYELRARFFGTKRNLQYLSDGGHFENTGIYELLRKRRGVRQIFACDCGADPHFGFEDLANLIRLARIDLGTDLVVQTEFEGELAHVFGAPGAFKPAVGRSGASPIPGVFEDEHLQYAKTTRAPRTPAALMLWATHVGETLPSVQIVILKPSVVSDVVADVQQYASEHPTFPQETTADQFFNEAQWESYRALGYHLATKIFNERMLGAIEALANKRMRPADLKRFD